MANSNDSTVKLPRAITQNFKPISTSEVIRTILTHPKFKGEPGSPGTTIKGDPGNDGESATIQIGKLETGPAGSEVKIENTGTVRNAVWNITIPKGFDGKPGESIKGDPGNDGLAATLQVGKVSTGLPGSAVEIKNVGTIRNAVLHITIPKGYDGKKGESIKGDPGNDGNAATINIAETVTLDPGLQATVQNVGTQTNAILKFGIPKGLPGENGKVPAHEVKGSSVRFQNPDGTWGKWLLVGGGGNSDTIYYPAPDVQVVEVDGAITPVYQMQYSDRVIHIVGITPVTVLLVEDPLQYKSIVTVKNYAAADATLIQTGGTINNVPELKIRARDLGIPGQRDPGLGNSRDFYSFKGQFWVK